MIVGLHIQTFLVAIVNKHDSSIFLQTLYGNFGVHQIGSLEHFREEDTELVTDSAIVSHYQILAKSFDLITSVWGFPESSLMHYYDFALVGKSPKEMPDQAKVSPPSASVSL
jgi:hypothetical protein